MKTKDYSTLSGRMLNKLIKLRMKQIRKLKNGEYTTVSKTVSQLEYELKAMTDEAMERSMLLSTDLPKTHNS